jgi:hypothetical protein
MWEYRLVWIESRPPGWDAAWRHGLEVLSAQRRSLEERPDTYLVLDRRPDAGLKLRGGGDDDFDLKIRHASEGGWELWEKYAFFKWNAVEAARLAVMLRIPPPPVSDDVTPGHGAEALLGAAGVTHRRVTVGKKRAQASSRELLATWPGLACDPIWLAELVEITLPGRSQPLFSLCLEAIEPPLGAGDPVPLEGGRRSGYPELLLEHLAGSF